MTVPADGKMSYAGAMTMARSKINLADIGIATVRPRWGVTGALVLEVPGEGGAAKADALAAKMTEALAETRALAGKVPFDLQATCLIRRTPPEPETKTVDAFERQAWRLALANWRLTYRATQVFIEYDCIGVYLCRIGKEAAAACHKCGEEEDSVQHTLEECADFSAQRRVLRSVTGHDLSLPAVVRAMLESDGNWRTVVFFCEEVISQME
ncbi:uncharacterized protein LOC128889943 [Hylaeus anthracinus]|uniref:uncharacterized protein LOC128889943 n=1 Tax=Hylaeus anthracinus TaxID=313031 RepID=UPI0023BA0DAD|nr:uncharacterized protein LOC128889943 [Hylaeus anthracinus]